MIENDIYPRFCKLEIIRLGTSFSLLKDERAILFGADGLPIWEHAYTVIGDWLTEHDYTSCNPLDNPIYDSVNGWTTHFSTYASRCPVFVRLVPPAMPPAAV